MKHRWPMMLPLTSRPFHVAVMLFLLPATGSAGAEREIHGRVVDEAGKPVAGVDVAYWWNANGPPTLMDKGGKPYDADTVEGAAAISAELGKMYPWGEKPAKTGLGGRFSISIGNSRHHLMAIDESSKRGGLAILPKDDEQTDIEIRLGPLVRVKGTLEGPAAGERPKGWSMVIVMVPDDPTRPLDSTRLALSGSVEARFEVSLPAGRYVLDAYTTRGNDADIEFARVIPDREILVTGKAPEIDVGVLRLSPFVPHVTTRIERAKAAGTWNDYTKHYGERLPPWHVVDARGVKKDVQISDFKGKWVLVYFWGMGCNPCLRTGIPNLSKFQDEHRADRDRFQVLSMCVDVDDDLKSMADLDKRLEPVVKHVWKKPIPFPVLLDPTFTTWERYGLTSFGTLILIDPEGKLVEGDEAVLAEKLKER